MAQKIEVFGAGCPTCQETVEMVKRIAAGTSQTVEVLDTYTDPILLPRRSSTAFSGCRAWP